MNNKIINLSDEREEILRDNITWVRFSYEEIVQIMTAMQEYAEWYHEEMSNKEYPFRKLAQKRLTKLKANGNDLDEYSISVPSEQDDASIGFV